MSHYETLPIAEAQRRRSGRWGGLWLAVVDNSAAGNATKMPAESGAWEAIRKRAPQEGYIARSALMDDGSRFAWLERRP